MKVIVFGGSGFVGSHVADALTAAGHEVTIFDRTVSPYLGPGQRMVQGDVLDLGAVQAAIAGNTVVYNFAGLADIEECLHLPIETIQANVLGCAHLLEGARRANVERFVFASSIYVYSDAGGFYRASKQACELYVEEYQRQFDLPFTVLRYGTLYGRRSDRRNSVYRYLSDALLTRKITTIGTGDELREYVHVEDAARASTEILVDEFKNQSVILTGQHPMRFRDLLNMIREIVGSDVEVDLQPVTTEMATLRSHYSYTPYTFRPRIGRRLVSHHYSDLGQGLLDCLDEIHNSNPSARSQEQ